MESPPVTPDSTTEPPPPILKLFQEGDDVFFSMDNGQLVLGSVGQIVGHTCQVLFGDGSSQWASFKRLKKLSFEVNDNDDDVSRPPPPPLPQPANNTQAQRSRSSNATNHHNPSVLSKIKPPASKAKKASHNVNLSCASCGVVKAISPKTARVFEGDSKNYFKCKRCINRNQTNSAPPFHHMHFQSNSAAQSGNGITKSAYKVPIPGSIGIKVGSGGDMGSSTSHGLPVPTSEKGVHIQHPNQGTPALNSIGFPRAIQIPIPLLPPGSNLNNCFHCEKGTRDYDRVYCNMCKRPCHLTCLPLSPTPLNGDTFWDLMCSVCGTQNGKGESSGLGLRVFSVRRNITSWADVAQLIINCLAVERSLPQRFYDLDGDIMPFIELNLLRLHLPRQYKLPPLDKQREYLQTALMGSRLRFQNGREAKQKKSGWAIRREAFIYVARAGTSGAPAVQGSVLANTVGAQVGKGSKDQPGRKMTSDPSQTSQKRVNQQSLQSAHSESSNAPGSIVDDNGKSKQSPRLKVRSPTGGVVIVKSGSTLDVQKGSSEGHTGSSSNDGGSTSSDLQGIQSDDCPTRFSKSNGKQGRGVTDPGNQAGTSFSHGHHSFKDKKLSSNSEKKRLVENQKNRLRGRLSSVKKSKIPESKTSPKSPMKDIKSQQGNVTPTSKQMSSNSVSSHSNDSMNLPVGQGSSHAGLKVAIKSSSMIPGNLISSDEDKIEEDLVEPEPMSSGGPMEMEVQQNIGSILPVEHKTVSPIINRIKGKGKGKPLRPNKHPTKGIGLKGKRLRLGGPSGTKGKLLWSVKPEQPDPTFTPTSVNVMGSSLYQAALWGGYNLSCLPPTPATPREALLETLSVFSHLRTERTDETAALLLSRRGDQKETRSQTRVKSELYGLNQNRDLNDLQSYEVLGSRVDEAGITRHLVIWKSQNGRGWSDDEDFDQENGPTVQRGTKRLRRSGSLTEVTPKKEPVKKLKALTLTSPQRPQQQQPHFVVDLTDSS